MKPVIIIGAGWAGLAAAADLCHHGIPVRLVEAAAHIGGRARRVYHGGRPLDTGQHLFLGAFRETLALLQQIGVSEASVFERMPLQLCIRSAHRDIRVKLGNHPAPLHLVRGLQNLSGVSLSERFRAVGLGVSLARHRFSMGEDMCVADWLGQNHQSPALIHGIWEPLCRATLNTPAREASAEVFLRVLHDAFLRRREDSDLLIPRTDLSSILPDPAAAFIRAHGGSIEVDTQVTGLEIDQGSVTGVSTAAGTLAADRIIIAVPSGVCRELLSPHQAFRVITGKLGSLTTTPICTVYLEYPRPVTLDAPFVGIVNGTPYWIFDRTRQNQPNIIAVVISGAGPHTEMNDDALVQQVGEKLTHYYPHWPAPESRTVIRDSAATFACRTGINAVRPGNATPVQGCWLAGDYTATGYPATLEGAVKSGREAARQIIEDLH